MRQPTPRPFVLLGRIGWGIGLISLIGGGGGSYLVMVSNNFTSPYLEARLNELRGSMMTFVAYEFARILAFSVVGLLFLIVGGQMGRGRLRSRVRGIVLAVVALVIQVFLMMYSTFVIHPGVGPHQFFGNPNYGASVASIMVVLLSVLSLLNGLYALAVLLVLASPAIQEDLESPKTEPAHAPSH